MAWDSDCMPPHYRHSLCSAQFPAVMRQGPSSPSSLMLHLLLVAHTSVQSCIKLQSKCRVCLVLPLGILMLSDLLAQQPMAAVLKYKPGMAPWTDTDVTSSLQAKIQTRGKPCIVLVLSCPLYQSPARLSLRVASNLSSQITSQTKNCHFNARGPEIQPHWNPFKMKIQITDTHQAVFPPQVSASLNPVFMFPLSLCIIFSRPHAFQKNEFLIS